MNDTQMYKELQDFANAHTLAKDIKVEITPYSTRFLPRAGCEGMKYEDVQLLSSLIQGAQHYLWWKRRKADEKKRDIQE